MNRQLKREQERKAAKLTAWINSLTPEQERAISYLVDEKVNKLAWSINQALDTSVAAALNTKTDMKISEIEDILSLSRDYMKDSEEFLIKYKETWIMKIKELEPKIKEESLKLLDACKNQQQSIKALGEIFKDVPTKDLVNIFKEAKEEWCKRCPTIDKTEKKDVETNNSFEVLEKKLKFKGEYYDYEKDSTGLKVGVEFFRSLEEIEAFRKREEEEFKKMIAEVRAAFAFEG